MTRPSTPAQLAGRRRDHLAALLHRTFAAVEHQVRQGMGARGYPIEQVYLPIVRNLPPEGARISEIAQRAGLAKQTVGPLVRELQRRGIIRVVQDPTDRRAKLVRFTPLGLRGLKAGLDAVAAVEQRCRRVLGAKRFERLKADLRHVSGTLADSE